MYTKIEAKHPDILLLERRIKQLVRFEDYGQAAIIKKWLDELMVHHHGDLMMK